MLIRAQKVEPVVKSILETKPGTRDDDEFLYLEYINRCHHTLAKSMSVGEFLRWGRRTIGITSYETVTRIRRKLQAEFPELRGNSKRQAERANAEQEFRAYALEGEAYDTVRVSASTSE